MVASMIMANSYIKNSLNLPKIVTAIAIKLGCFLLLKGVLWALEKAKIS